jgi:hypothetical protein
LPPRPPSLWLRRCSTIPWILDKGAFEFHNPTQGGWVAEKGDFTTLVGGSSRTIALQGNHRLAETVFEKDCGWEIIFGKTMSYLNL